MVKTELPSEEERLNSPAESGQITPKEDLAKKQSQDKLKEKDWFACQTCFKTFKCKYKVLRHETIHSKEKLACKLCEKVFLKRKNLTIHEKIHAGEKPFECRFCDHCSTSKGNLRQHEEWRHSDQKTFECQICHKAFKTKRDLKKHGITHSQEMNFHCGKCDNSSAKKTWWPMNKSTRKSILTYVTFVRKVSREKYL